MFQGYRTLATGLVAIPFVQLLSIGDLLTPEVAQLLTNFLLGLAAAFLRMAIGNK